jgi:FkbM family methyltransferase
MIIARFLRRLKLAPKLNWSSRTRLNGRNFEIPLIGLHGYGNLNISEPWMHKLFMSISPMIDSNGIFVDVGTNIGQTLLKMRSVWPKMPYIGFEPNPFCVHYVNELCRVNGFQDVVVYPFGVGENTSVLHLHFYSENDEDSAASVVENFRPNEPVHHTMPVVLLPPTMVPWKKRISLIKVDVEGAELDVLNALTQQIGKDRPIVLTEILPVYNTQNVARLDKQRQIEKLFSEQRYRCYRIVRSAGEVFQELQHITEIEVHSSLALCDYLWLPVERIGELENHILN